MKDIHAFEPIWENWVIDGYIDSGSYGSVWKAHREDQFSHVRQVAAVKHISIPKQDGRGEGDIPFPSEEAKSKYYRNMLNQLIGEIDAMISLRGKPNIVSYEEHKVVPKENNCGYDLFLRMELLESISVYCPIANYTEHPLPRNEIIQLGIDIATALEILENRNLVHRDIKPNNIFRDEEGHFKLGDFGTARVLEPTGNASTKAGTPNYMAPEVYSNLGRYDQTVDIYSLGIMLYVYLNNGYLPFMSDNELDKEIALTKRIHGEVIKSPCNADEGLSRVVLKACAFKPEDRYQNAKELKNDLIKCQEQVNADIDIPVICQLDDGQVLYRGIKKGQRGSNVLVSTADIPYKQFVKEDKELISDRGITISVDENGVPSPHEAVFVLSDCKTLFAVSVQIICQDENQNELLAKRMDCFYQNRNLAKAPVIDGYIPIGQTEVEVEVLKNRTTKPLQVVFVYRKESDLQPPVDEKPAECEILIQCVSENGEKLSYSWKTCRENASNLVKAPEITDYTLIGKSTEEISVNHEGKAIPERVYFTYRKKKTEKKRVAIPVICRDDYGNVLRKDSVVGITGETLNIAAPEIKGYHLINENKRNIALAIDDEGVAEQDEVIFVYEKEKKAGKNLWKYAVIFGLLLTVGIVAWLLLNKPAYTITWINEDGTVLETDSGVKSGTMPEYNGRTPTKSSDDQYSYAFAGWSPDLQTASADQTYKAVYERAKLSTSSLSPTSTQPPMPTNTETISEVISEYETELARVKASEVDLDAALETAVAEAELETPLLDESLLDVLKSAITAAGEGKVDLSTIAPSSEQEYKDATAALKEISYEPLIEALKTAEADVKRSRVKYALVNAPEETFVMDRLSRVQNISFLLPASAENDPEGLLGKDGCTVVVYFSSPLVDPEYAENPGIDLAEGVSYGGCVEVYDTAENARNRERTLNGTHRALGTVVIRFSDKLKEEDRQALEEAIVEQLIAEEPGEVVAKEGVQPTPEPTPHPEKWICLACGLENDSGDDYCINCGVEKGKTSEQTEAKTGIDGISKSTDKWICWICSWENDSGDGYCVNCGAGRGTTPTPEAVITPAPSKPPVGTLVNRYWRTNGIVMLRYKPTIGFGDNIFTEIGKDEYIYVVRIESHNGYTWALVMVDDKYYYTFIERLDPLTSEDSNTYAANLSTVPPIIDENDLRPKEPKPFDKTAQVGDLIIYGRYEQSNQSNGKEDIEWIVLAVNGDEYLLLSRYALDCQKFNSSSNKNSWEGSTIRQWLKVQFYNKAFSKTEKNAIITKHDDKVFLLSYDESSLYLTNETSECQPTEYTIKNNGQKAANGNCSWWLRTPDDSNCAMIIDTNGEFNSSSVQTADCCVRPAMWVTVNPATPTWHPVPTKTPRPAPAPATEDSSSETNDGTNTPETGDEGSTNNQGTDNGTDYESGSGNEDVPDNPVPDGGSDEGSSSGEDYIPDMVELD